MAKSEGTNYPIELMRIVGVILITFTHTRHNFVSGAPYFILEVVPKYGTLLLSVISGYLYYNYHSNPDLLNKKVKSLLIPYLIANLAVIIPVLLINALGYNYLNRLTYDATLITNGLLSVNDVPINPPTYFIRDLFVIFCFLALLQKDYRGLLVIIPLAIFGQVLIRYNIALLFLAGFLIRKFEIYAIPLWIKLAVTIPAVVLSICFFEFDTYKFVVAISIFLVLVNLQFNFVKTGGYTYFLHLYHSPLIVFIAPLIGLFHPNAYVYVTAQILLAIIICYLAYFVLVKKCNLRIITGNR